MADIEDISTYLLNAATAAVYPSGSAGPSVVPAPPGYASPMDVRLYKGWPIADQLDLDVQGLTVLGAAHGSPPIPRTNGPCANVSVFPLYDMTATPYQIYNNETYIITPPVYGLTVAASGGQVTITGTPSVGEYVSILADRQFIFSSGGASSADVLGALLAAAQAHYPAATLVGNTLTIPFGYQFDVRQGAVGTLGYVTHRQSHMVAVTVWAPNQAARLALAQAIDNYVKRSIVVAMPDTTQAKIVYSRTRVIDDMQNTSVYRRDLIYACEYATVFEFPGTVITSVTTDTIAGNLSLGTPPTIPQIN